MEKLVIRLLLQPITWTGLIGSFLWGQPLLVGRAIGPGGSLQGADTALPAGILTVRFQLPTGWAQDTFLLIARNALGPVARAQLFPHPTFKGYAYGKLNLARPGFYLLIVYRPRGGSKVWATRRLYVLAPPYTTIGQVRAYHNALLSRAKSAPTSPAQPPTYEPPPAEAQIIEAPLPDAEPISVSLTEEDFTLPELNLEPTSSEENTDMLLEEDLLDD